MLDSGTDAEFCREVLQKESRSNFGEDYYAAMVAVAA